VAARDVNEGPRDERFPSVLAVGLSERADPAAARVVERLVRRNVLNMYPLISRAPS
jgi:hypothetical protein